MKKLFAVLFIALMAMTALAVVQTADAIGLDISTVKGLANSGLIPVSFQTLVIVGVILAVLMCAAVALSITMAVKFCSRAFRILWTSVKAAAWLTKTLLIHLIAGTKIAIRIAQEARNDGTREYIRRPALYTRIWGTPTIVGYRNRVREVMEPTVTTAKAFRSDPALEIRNFASSLLLELFKMITNVRRWVIFTLFRKSALRKIFRVGRAVFFSVKSGLLLANEVIRQASTSTQLYVEQETTSEGVPPYIRQRAAIFIKVVVTETFRMGRVVLAPRFAGRRKK